MIDRLDFSKFKAAPKWIVGFSDITVLNSHIDANYSIETIHGQMPLTIPEGTAISLETLRKALFNEPLSYQWNIATALGNRPGKPNGILVGGNLSILVSVLESISEIDYRDKILFIEDVGEYLYEIDRMMGLLARPQRITPFKALIIGTFAKVKDAAVPFGQTYQEIVMKVVKDYGYPVCFDFLAEHIPDNRALILGRQVHLDVRPNKASLIY